MSAEKLARPLVVAIDGPAASGKGTLARQLAAHFGMAHLDTGKLYRAVGYGLLKHDISFTSSLLPEDQAVAIFLAKKLTLEQTQNPELRSEEVGRAASVVSAIPPVRSALLDFQRKIAKSANGAVLDGRDIGTVVCPNADVKLFITASIEARAERRYKELQNQGDGVIKAAILQDLQERDARDSKRSVAPLKPAENAITIDTTNLSQDAVFAQAKAIIISAASH